MPLPNDQGREADELKPGPRMLRCNSCGVSKPRHSFYDRNRRCKPCKRQEDEIRYRRADEIARRRVRQRIAHRKRYRSDVRFRLQCDVRRRINNALQGDAKSYDTCTMIGCSMLQLQWHIECKFDEHMNWSNKGRWHIDHKIPVSAFDATNAMELRACHSYLNLQPMWAHENLRKSNTYCPAEKEDYMRRWRMLQTMAY